jgi:hypothetical protein
MRGIGVHVREGCGKVYDNIGAYLDCRETHLDAELWEARSWGWYGSDDGEV